MKKRWILLILPLMMMVMPVASANGWGLPEALVPLVSNTNDYDDYYHWRMIMRGRRIARASSCRAAITIS